MKKVNLVSFVKTPNCPVCIRWKVDGSSGHITCEAWRGQYEIERLERDGYAIVSVEKGEL